MIRRLPLFPLPGVVLLPGTLLPLHVFEDRYRSLIADVLQSDRTIGMAMWNPGEEGCGNGPALHAVGGAGEIVESEELEDGRYNILLEARFRFRILGEEELERPYRVARVEEIRSLPFGDPVQQSRALTGAVALFTDLAPSLELPPLPADALSAERLASEIALRLRYSPQELQAILETDALPARFEALTGRLAEWKARMQFLAPFRPTELDARRN